MASNPSTIERAFELARNSSCTDVQDIIRTLRKEGYSSVEAHLTGMSIRKQLRELCLARKG